MLLQKLKGQFVFQIELNYVILIHLSTNFVILRGEGSYENQTFQGGISVILLGVFIKFRRNLGVSLGGIPIMQFLGVSQFPMEIKHFRGDMYPFLFFHVGWGGSHKILEMSVGREVL